MKLVEEYMKKAVIVLSPEDRVLDVINIFSENNISGAPVVENGKVIGVVSESDIIKFLSKDLVEFPKPKTNIQLMMLEIVKSQIELKVSIKKQLDTKIKDIMNKNVVTISPKDGILKAAEIMSKNDVRRLPVTENGKLVGIISRTDLLKAFSEF